MAKWVTKPVIVNAYVITNVSPLTDDGGLDITIEHERGREIRHAAPSVLRFMSPQEGDYWVEHETVAMPWPKAEFEKRHTKQED